LVVEVTGMLNYKKPEADGGGLSKRLLGFLLLGIAILFIGIAILIVTSISLAGSEGVSGVILIGPIPIVFGAGPDVGWLIAVSIILTILSIVLFLIMNKHARKLLLKEDFLL
jgi:uncharacterized membrane protein